MSGAIRNRSTPGIRSNQNPMVYPDSADVVVMPSSPLLTRAAKMPDRLLPIPVERNHPPMPKPTSRSGASLVTIERPMGERHSSPTDWMQYTVNSVQNGISPAGLTSDDSANTVSYTHLTLPTSDLV